MQGVFGGSDPTKDDKLTTTETADKTHTSEIEDNQGTSSATPKEG